MYLLTAIEFTQETEETVEIRQEIFPDGETIEKVKQFAETKFPDRKALLIIYQCPCSAYGGTNCVPLFYRKKDDWIEIEEKRGD